MPPKYWELRRRQGSTQNPRKAKLEHFSGSLTTYRDTGSNTYIKR